jgi:single-strand DNA-binding protein
MAGVNKVILIGNLGADPEVRHLQNGASVANFRMATTESFRVKVTGADGKDNWENREQTEWHNIVAWRGLATLTERYLKKGSKVYVEGKLRNRQYQDKDNNTRYITEVQADEMRLLDRPASSQGAGQATTAPAQAATPVPAAPVATGPDEMDDLPF